MKPRDLLNNRHSDTLKKSQLTLSQGKLKRGDVNDATDDDEVRTTVSQNCVTATHNTVEFFLRTQ
jgi:hypothetical protein